MFQTRQPFFGLCFGPSGYTRSCWKCLHAPSGHCHPPRPTKVEYDMGDSFPAALHVGQKNPVLSHGSIGTPPDQIGIDCEISSLVSPRVRPGEDIRSTPPISPLPAIGSSIATAIIFEELRGRRAARMGLKRTQLSVPQNMLAALPSLLLGLAVAIVLSVLEVSLRGCFQRTSAPFQNLLGVD